MSQLSVDCLSAPNWSFTVFSAKKGSGPFKYLSFTACHSVRLCQPWRDTAVTRGLPSWFWGSGSAASWDPGILSMSYSWSTWGLPGSQLLWCRHWPQHQALRVHVAFPAPVSAVGSFFTARLWQVASQAPSSFRAWPASRTPPPAASPAPGDFMQSAFRDHLLCNGPCILENWFTPNSTDAVTALPSSGL